jgi:hypothetical protein
MEKSELILSILSIYWRVTKVLSIPEHLGVKRTELALEMMLEDEVVKMKYAKRRESETERHEVA